MTTEIPERPSPAGSQDQPLGHAAVSFSRGFPSWLARQKCSIAITTYRIGRLVLIGLNSDGSLHLQNQHIEQCQGLWTDGQSMRVGALSSLWRYQNTIAANSFTDAGTDRLFAPREARVTGQIDIHDIAEGNLTQIGGGERDVVFVSTAFNCLATTSKTASFKPLWHPPFVSGIVGEDRCHLNGLAIVDDRPAYVTTVGTEDVAGSWRNQRTSGGLVLEIQTGSPVVSGLSMPHSPRVYDQKLWVLDSGRGNLCIVDTQRSEITRVADMQGYARGLSFTGRFAVVGLSRPRTNDIFSGLELDDKIKKSGNAAMCGVAVVNIDTGQVEEWLSFGEPVNEIYDVAVLQGVRRPEATSMYGDDVRRVVSVEAM